MKYSDNFVKGSSRILLGTTYFDDGISKEDSFLLMDAYRDLGGNHLDTARLYADGRAEEVVGEWLHLRGKQNMFVSTKGGCPKGSAIGKVRLSEDDIRDDIEASLKALKMDFVDFYWLHRDDENVPEGEVIEMMNKFLKEGKFKNFGASNWTSGRIKKANEYAKEHNLVGFTASQIRFNPASYANEREGLVGMDKNEFSYYKEQNMSVIAYSSQAKGFFSKMQQGGVEILSQKTRNRYYYKENIEKSEIINSLSLKYQKSAAQIISAAFCSFSKPDVFPIIGCSNTSQLKDSMSGSDLELSEEEVNLVFKNVIN